MEHINPLESNFLTRHQTPPFLTIATSDFLPAINEAISRSKSQVACITSNAAHPGFENTVEELEKVGKDLKRVTEIFFNLLAAEANPGLQDIAREVSALVTGYSNDIWLDQALFDRVKTVYESKRDLALEGYQEKLLDDTYNSFVRRGALLSPEHKARYREVSLELARLQVEFGENLLAETNDFKLHISDPVDLEGLPGGVIEAAAQLASEEGKEGWMFSLNAPSMVPFLKYSANRAAREKLFRASAGRCNRGNSRDNKSNLLRQANLRLEMANLLGFRTYADLVLEDRMAGTTSKVNSFLDDLLDKSLAVAKININEVEEFAKKEGLPGPLEKWDFLYYSEKLKNSMFDVDDEITRPYLELNNVTREIFNLTGKLWGITYKLENHIQVYHPDVKAYEVFDQNGEFLAVLYLDFFPRKTKQGGAWMTTFRDQYYQNGVDTRPQVSLVCNFTPPTATRPSLLTYNEFTTFLHEFGHALHAIFSKVCYESQSGTNVARDFVELPSQLLENWAREEEWLQQVALHYQTGKTIPRELVDKILSSANFQSGYQLTRQLGFAFIDMAWHTITTPVTVSPEIFEQAATSRVDLLPPVDGSCTSTAFSHIFDGGYAAGYYGYKWAEVLDADAYSLFKENGIFDRGTAERFREAILSKGGSLAPMKLFISFRGKEPSIEPLLRRCGLVKQ